MQIISFSLTPWFTSCITGNYTKVFNVLIKYFIQAWEPSVCSLYILNEKTTFEAVERIKGHFLDQIIDGGHLTEKEILTRGKYIQTDFNAPYCIAALKYDNGNAGSERTGIFRQHFAQRSLPLRQREKIQAVLSEALPVIP